MKDPALDPALDPRSLTPEEWRAILGPAEFAILRESATERPGTGRYLDDPGPGAFHCAGCGQRLYGAAHKFHSGCGWPSFFREVEPGALEVHTDRSHWMVRTEMRCSRCGGHMGHIFEDAPSARARPQPLRDSTRAARAAVVEGEASLPLAAPRHPLRATTAESARFARPLDLGSAEPTGLRHCVNGQAILHVPEGADPREVFARHRG